MALITSIVSDPLFTTISTDSTADLTVEAFNDADTTVYAIEITNPNADGVWVRINWAGSGNTLTTTQYDNVFYCGPNSTCSIYAGGGYAIGAGVEVWCSTQPGVHSVAGVTVTAPGKPVTIKMAFKNT
jgi:hypothetical protein